MGKYLPNPDSGRELEAPIQTERKQVWVRAMRSNTLVFGSNGKGRKFNLGSYAIRKASVGAIDAV
jgi:hypothetical protein